MSALAKRAKAANLDAIHDTVHEMARDEARHDKALKDLLRDTSAKKKLIKSRKNNYLRRLAHLGESPFLCKQLCK